MGLVNVVGFCTTAFPDGTTGSVPGAWAQAPLARTSAPTNANRTDANFFIGLPLWTQRLVTTRTIRAGYCPRQGRTADNSFSFCPFTDKFVPSFTMLRDHGTSGVAA